MTNGVGGASGFLAGAALSSGNLLLGGNAAFRSTDGGTSWQKVDTGLVAGQVVSALKILPNDDIYVGTGIAETFIGAHGVSRLSKGAAGWTDLPSGLNAIRAADPTASTPPTKIVAPGPT